MCLTVFRGDAAGRKKAYGAAFGILSGILAMPFPRGRQEKDDCRISTARGPQKGKKENKRCLHAFPARRPD